MNTKSFLAIALATTLAVHAQEGTDPYKKAGGAGGDAGAGLEEALVESAPKFVSIREETFSLPIADAYDLMHSTKSDAEMYAALVKQMKAGTARLERLLVLRTKSGQRAVVESIDELRYPQEYNVVNPPEPLNRAAKTAAPPAPPIPVGAAEPFATGFDTRNVGDTLEIEPVVGPDGRMIDLNLVPQSVRFAGYQQSTKESWAKQPLFETQKLTTSITVQDGEPSFLGTLNPPFGNGLAIEQKEHRVWLDFITVDIVAVEPKALAQTKTTELAKAIILPRLDFRDATIVEAIDFLRKKSAELDPDKKGINFVASIPPSFAPVKINLTLQNVSLLDVVKHITKIAGLGFTAQENALVIHGGGQRY
jgi:hypothetical protein